MAPILHNVQFSRSLARLDSRRIRWSARVNEEEAKVDGRDAHVSLGVVVQLSDNGLEPS